jgi:alanine dehydrogenase
VETLLLNQDEVGSLVDRDAVLAAVEEGYRSFNSGKVVQPDFMLLDIPGSRRGWDVKGGMDLGSGFMSLKASSGGNDDNPKVGLPVAMNTVLLFELQHCTLQCVMDGSWITRVRTGAAGAISVKYLARQDAKVLAVIGSGKQARNQLLAMMRVRKLTEVRVWDALTQFLDEYVEEMAAETGLKIVKCGSAEEAVRPADIIVTTTRGRSGPLVKREWVKPGTHIAAVGADAPGKQEIDAEIFRGAKVYCDSIPLCLHHGEVRNPVEGGIIAREEIRGEIGEILLGTKPGRENADEITIFDTVGMAIQDVAMAVSLYRAALEKGMGTRYAFFK